MVIGTRPVYELAPQEYRYALDACAGLLANTPPLVINNLPELTGEIQQRFPVTDESVTGAIWLEPMRLDWSGQIKKLENLANGAPLLVIASQPLARILPERRGWQGQPVGLRPGGLGQLRRALQRSGFSLSARYGLHTPLSIGLNLLSGRLDRLGQKALADRVYFAARLRYRSTGLTAPLATVGLWHFSKGGG